MIICSIVLHFSADILTDYVEFVGEENSKKKIIENEDAQEKGTQECIDHLMVVEEVEPAPKPTVDEATLIRIEGN